MSEPRNLKLDLLALGLLALTAFLAVALVTYDPADPVGQPLPPLDRLYQPDILVYPQNEAVTNACGRSGALVADLLLTALGIGAYYLMVSLAAVDVLLFRRRPLDTPLLRALGWAISLIGLTTLTATLLPGLTAGPVIGSGGYLGALGHGLLEMHFATAGGLILTLSLLLGGLLLCTDYLLVRLAAAVARIVWAVMRGAGQRLTAVRLRRSGPSSATGKTNATKTASKAKGEGKTKEEILPESELEPEESVEEPDDEEPARLPVRIRGKHVSEADDEAEPLEPMPDAESEAALASQEREFEEEEEEDEEEFEEQDEPPADGKKSGRKGQKRVSGPHFRIPKKGGKGSAGEDERQDMLQQLEEAVRNEEPAGDYQLPDIDLLLPGDDVCYEEQEREVRRKAKILEKTFAEFGFTVKVVEIETGPVIAQYEVQLEAGLRLSKITGLADDLAIALRVPSVRIVAPIPGKNTVGIEVPNETRQVVRLREVIEETNGKTAKMRIPLFLGKDVSGNALTADLSTLPHLLIAGRTGTGKSVCLNAIISSILMTKRPDEVRMLMIDPKMVELSGYGRLPHLMHPVVTDMRKAEAILAWAVEKMEERYSLLARAGVRHISSYNQLGEEELMERLQPEDEDERKVIPAQLPFIVIVADEMADLMMTAGKEVEQHIIRLAQKSRAVGIHLILATQKPTVDVITGLIKSNLPARIAFQVASRTDSRVVLDEMGADKLLGNGDMLFLWPGTSTLLRGQGTYLGDDEINAIVDAVSRGEQNFVNELINLQVEEPSENSPGALKKRDDLYEAAVDVVVREGRGSVSLLQRTLGIGYGRAARLIDFMAEDGIVGTYAGSQAREVTISLADWEQMQKGEAAPDPAAEPEPPKPRRTNKVRPEPGWDDQPEPPAPPPAPQDELKEEEPDEEEPDEEEADENWDEEEDEEDEEVAEEEDYGDEEDAEYQDEEDEEDYPRYGAESA